MMMKPVVYHIPVCPFSQRLEIMLALKDRRGDVLFKVVDITKPRDPVLLDKMQGTTALPVLETTDGKIIKESLVILAWLDATTGNKTIARQDPYERAVEQMLIAKEGPFTMAGYLYLMNQARAQTKTHQQTMLDQFAALNEFVRHHNPKGDYLFESFGLAEVVFTPIFMRFWFLEYYEHFQLPQGAAFERVRRWRDACLAHPAAQQVTKEEIVKLYYDYALGAGNGALPPGREKSSFSFAPHWPLRPWPPREKYGPPATDEMLGLK